VDGGGSVLCAAGGFVCVVATPGIFPLIEVLLIEMLRSSYIIDRKTLEVARKMRPGSIIL